MPTKNIKTSFFAYYFLTGQLHHSSKKKNHTEVKKNSRNQGFSSYFV
jgi:hypothetical protein